MDEQQRRRMQRATSVMLNMRTGRAFRTWRDFHDEIMADREEKFRRFQILFSVKAWNMWRGVVQTSRVAKGILKRIMSRALAGAFDRWMEFIDECRDLNAKCRKVLMKIMQRSMVRQCKLDPSLKAPSFKL